jgi:hypothetical protein
MRRIGVIAAALLASGAAGASAQTGPMWNTGYGWWPGGFGYPPVTVRAPDYPCSVTAYGPTFRSQPRQWRQAYGAGTSCNGGVGVKTLTVSEQVLGQDGHTWYTITGSTVTLGPRTGNPVRIIRHRRAYLGHVYRTVATARLVVPNGHAGCSLSNTCDQTLVISARSRRLAP